MRQQIQVSQQEMQDPQVASSIAVLNDIQADINRKHMHQKLAMDKLTARLGQIRTPTT